MHKVTFHRDGTITFWDVYAQSWERTSAPADRDLASMGPRVRARVLRHLGRGEAAERIVRISARTVGRNFGTEGVIRARNGRDLATTGPHPLGFTSAALTAAADLARRNGWTVENA